MTDERELSWVGASWQHGLELAKIEEQQWRPKMADESKRDGPTMEMGLPKEGWCNACSARPPYSPNLTYQLRCKGFVITFCPTCARKTQGLFTDMIENEDRSADVSPPA